MLFWITFGHQMLHMALDQSNFWLWHVEAWKCFHSVVVPFGCWLAVCEVNKILCHVAEAWPRTLGSIFLCLL